MTATDPRLTPAQAAALHGLAQFPLVAALLGRRSRRFALGDEIPDGPLAYRSAHDPQPLTELERLLVLGDGRHHRLVRPRSGPPTRPGRPRARR